VLCLCGRNDKLRARIAKRFAGEPRLKLMGFTDRMGDVLAASDALVHSSAGLTVLEAIIRGCPVISYGFGYGHVRASNHALVRFGLAQVARHESDIGPALKRALVKRPEPDGSFARRPSTASLILGDERRARTLPRWRVRTARVATATAVAVALSSWTLTAGVPYTLVSKVVHMKPTTAVETTQPEVGVLVDAPAAEVPALASALWDRGVRVSFAVDQVSAPAVGSALVYGDQAVPRLPNGGLVRWLGASRRLHHLSHAFGFSPHHFLYTSNGPSLGQWLIAHGAGGRLIAGAVRVDDRGDQLAVLHPGEIVELSVNDLATLRPLLAELARRLHAEHLTAVPVGQLLRDAGSSV
jgi:hypothetical protein